MWLVCFLFQIALRQEIIQKSIFKIVQNHILVFLSDFHFDFFSDFLRSNPIISKLLPDLKRIQVVDFLDVDLRHELAHFSDVIQQVAGSVAFQVCHHALLVRGRVEVPSQLAVEPEATTALEGIAVAAQGRVVELKQLRIKNAQTFFQITD